jgi:hypothetical protein
MPVVGAMSATDMAKVSGRFSRLANVVVVNCILHEHAWERLLPILSGGARLGDFGIPNFCSPDRESQGFGR